MTIQQKISKENLKKNIGKQMEVLIENTSFDGEYLIGRTKNDVPDIDGIVYIKKNSENEKYLDKIVNAKIVDVDNYDLIAEFIN